MKYKLGDIIQIDLKFPEVGGWIGVIAQGQYENLTHMDREGVTYYSVLMEDRYYWVRETTFELADLTPLQKVFYEL